MKIILKKPLWFTVITILCLVVVTLFAASGCDKTEILPKHCVLNFAGESVSIESQTIAHGGYATAPESPQREGYSFGGWFTDNGTFANKWDFKTNIVTQDTTLYAKWEENTLDYPIEIPFTEYSLVGTSCQWRNFEFNKVIIINNEEELGSYISCSSGNYPEIDFSKYTLLLARGGGTSNIHTFEMQLQQISISEYSLYVDITRGMAAFPQPWLISIQVPKLSQNDVVVLNVNDHY